MSERNWIELIVERVAGQVLDSHVASLRAEIGRRVMEEIAAAPNSSQIAGGALSAEQERGSTSPSTSTSGSHTATELARDVAEIQLGTSQREILRALLDTSSRYAARVALFVVKGSRATGWQGRGFENCDAVKDFALDENAPAVVNAIVDRVLTTAPVAAFDGRFLREVGAPASGEGCIFPLILKDKVAALIYADSGAGNSTLLDLGSIELLVLSTSAWLEVNSLRKASLKEMPTVRAESRSQEGYAEENRTTEAAASQPTPPPAYNDPFASHSAQAMAAAASTGISGPVAATHAESAPMADGFSQPTVQGVTAQEVSAQYSNATLEASSTSAAQLEPVASAPELAVSEPILAGPANAEAEAEVRAEPQPPVAESPAEQEVHSKAQRFARLLVDEIKLYNQAKVVEGRKNKDIYERLKEVIEKSRATYQKRYGATAATSGNYFHREIIRSLAEDDPSIMGANFRQ
jgi:hypothetical protein